MASNHTNGSPRPSPPFRFRDGSLATLSILGGLVMLLGLTRVDIIHYAQQRDLYYITVALIALSLPGPIVTLWDLPGQLLLWNALGWGLGLSILGLPSIGATPLLPLVLLAIALTFWPRPDDLPIPWLGAMIALVGGFLTCWALWGNEYGEIPFMTI